MKIEKVKIGQVLTGKDRYGNQVRGVAFDTDDKAGTVTLIPEPTIFAVIDVENLEPVKPARGS